VDDPSSQVQGRLLGAGRQPQGDALMHSERDRALGPKAAKREVLQVKPALGLAGVLARPQQVVAARGYRQLRTEAAEAPALA